MSAHSDDSVERLADEARIGLAAAERTRRRAYDEQVAVEATFTGTLAALADDGAPVTIETVDGGRAHGTLAAVGTDHVVLDGRGSCTGIALDAVRAVQLARGPARLGVGGGQARRATTLAGLLQEALDEGRALVIRCIGAARPVAGEVIVLGEDVMVVAEHAASTKRTVVPWSVVAEVRIGRVA